MTRVCAASAFEAERQTVLGASPSPCVAVWPSCSSKRVERLADQTLGLGGVAPVLGLDPLAGLEVLVVLEEVLDLLARVLRDVVDVLDVRPARVLARAPR